jgi:Cys-tRNA(Pro)/Cys-tRNA(Cys) deacylase
MANLSKTNALRQLETLAIPYEPMPYAVGDEHLDAVEIAAQLGVDPDCTFKTLVAHSEKNLPAVFCLPSNSELNLKKAARAMDAKSCELIHVKELFALTGYVRGGCAPIGMKKKFPTFIDEIALAYEQMYINAGQRGLLIRIAPADLARACDGRFADLV